MEKHYKIFFKRKVPPSLISPFLVCSNEQRYICVSDLIVIKEDAQSYLLLQIDYLFKLRKVKRIVIFQLFLKEGEILGAMQLCLH